MSTLLTQSHARISFVRHLREQWNNNPATSTYPPANIPTDIPASNSTTTNIIVSDDYLADAPPPPFTNIIHPTLTNAQITATSYVNTPASHTSSTDGTTSDVPSSAIFSTSTLTSSDVGSVPTCPHCDRTFTSHIGLIGRLRMHCTETGELVPGLRTCTHRIRFHFSNCPFTFIRPIGLLGNVRIRDSRIRCGFDITSALCTPTMLRSINTPSPRTPTITTTIVADSVISDLSWPQCPRTFNSDNGLAGHWQTSAWNTDALQTPSPRLPPLSPSNHRMDIIDHTRTHENLWQITEDTTISPYLPYQHMHHVHTTSKS
ncbi:hypothetical protein SprV_0501955000 [Sparganum proliferum]